MRGERKGMHTGENEAEGLVCNIQKYTIHDGPGIRTEIFLKGCPLSCRWCSNPEGIRPEVELGISPLKCVKRARCGWCVDACLRERADTPLVFDSDGVIEAVRQDAFCAQCMKCAEVCPGRAIMVWGCRMTVSGLMDIIEQDRDFYERSGGGVTLSGGEVMLQWEFAASLLKACRDAGIATCTESTLYCPPAHMDAVLAHTDLLITDIKCLDDERHQKYTGVSNERILENIRRAGAEGRKMVIRTPVVPGINDDEEEILSIGRFIKEELGASVLQYQLLPYRKMGTEKYASLGRAYPMDDALMPGREVWEPKLIALRDRLISVYDIPACAGSSQKLSLQR
jgi:pyruvate formate lyase activating enzyme